MSQIIAGKYLKDHTVDVWICSEHFPVIGTSYIWNRFIRTLSWITCQLGWRVGNVLHIRLGMDLIVGLNAPYLLSYGLRDYLYDVEITHLAHAQNLEYGTDIHEYWYIVVDLNLGGIWEEQWTDYVKGLTHRGIRLKSFDDTLL